VSFAAVICKLIEMKRLIVFVTALASIAAFAQTTPSELKKSETAKPAPSTTISNPAKTNLKKPDSKKVTHHVTPAKKEPVAPYKESKETTKDKPKN
jgi:hypothetical protein